MPYKYVLTGSSGAGKSCIITALEQKGEYVIREAARDLIEFQKASGFPEPMQIIDFEEQVFNLHLLREKRIPDIAERVFLDRGKLDHLAFSTYFNWPLSNTSKKEAENTDYNIIFLVEPFDAALGSIEAEKYTKRLRILPTIKTYEDFGYKLRRVPPGALADRVDFILKTIKQCEGASSQNF